VQKEYDCNSEMVAENLAEVSMMEKFFDGFKVWYVSRLDNHDTDYLSWIASSRAPTPPDVMLRNYPSPWSSQKNQPVKQLRLI
jgi:hypothetical protein